MKGDFRTISGSLSSMSPRGRMPGPNFVDQQRINDPQSGTADEVANAKTTGSGMKSKLAILNERINGFEKQMEAEARQRRESEEGRIAAIRDAICKLEKTLNAEIKRRVEASKSLQAVFETHISNAQDKLEAAFSDNVERLKEAVSSISERLSNAEKCFTSEKDKFQRATEEKQTMLVQDVSHLRAILQAETANRQDREAEIVKRFGDLELQTSCRFDVEKSAREQKYAKLLDTLEEAKNMLGKEDEQFQVVLLEEIAQLKSGLVLESQARENADDDIVLAVSHYTKALQDALTHVTIT